MKNYSILVNTCDRFEDCWDAFFKLFSIYWPMYEGRIYLNTEYKSYTYPNLDIVAIKGCRAKQDAHSITWSECLKRALDAVETDIVLYLQEDYFFNELVKSDIVESFASLMKENEDIHCIHLTDQAVKAEKKSLKYWNLYEVGLKQRYRISCQAALWKKEVLMSYIKSYENAWQFEEFGSKRAALLRHNFFVVDNKWVQKGNFEIIPYVFTGIIHGKWFEEVVPLFKKHDIKMDYEIRGFVGDEPKSKLKSKINRFILRLPVMIKSLISLYMLRFKLYVNR